MPGTEPPFRLDRATRDALVAHAWSDFPYEVCGLLGVRPDGSVEHRPMRNEERSMTYYVMDRSASARAILDFEDAGWDLVIYHSHTHTQAYPSRTDIEQAFYPDATYLIVSLQDRDAPEVRAFRIRDGEVAERPVEVVDGGDAADRG